MNAVRRLVGIIVVVISMCITGNIGADEVTSSPVAPKKNEGLWKGKWFTVGLELGIGAAYLGNYDVTHVPVGVRDIPRHPGDDWVGATPYLDEPIITDSIPETLENDPSFSGALVLQAWWLHLGYGLLRNSDTQHVRVSQNQFGTDRRGYGTTLRYYETHAEKRDKGYWQYGLTVPVFPRLWNGHGFTLGAGYVKERSPLVFVAEQGYDRWDRDHEYRTVEFAEIHNNPVPYCRIGYAYRHERLQSSVYVQYNTVATEDVTYRSGFKDTVIENDVDPRVSVGLSMLVGIK